MLTNLVARNFKRFGDLDIELGSPVVFIGPNNSGKTSAMQALALWNIGLKRWNEKRSGSDAPKSRPGVTVNRRDLVAIPVPAANLLWRGLHTRYVQRIDGRQRTDNVCIEIVVQGVRGTREWSCGLEFDYANPESFYCRPLRLDDGKQSERMPVPEEAGSVKVAFLPPMSGLAATETRLDPGAVDVRVGEGRTAEVLRNLCYRVHDEDSDSWDRLVGQIERLFGVQMETPCYVPERGEVTMGYREGKISLSLDISSSGRGLQQTLLILAYMYANPGTVLLLDEPDAHLEFLRQRQTYRLVTETAAETGSQIIAASHSEVLLNEAAGKDTVVAFVGEPHRIDDRGGQQVLKALKAIGFEHYVQAEQTGWVLYLEGSTDLDILQQFAQRLNHVRAMRALERPFVHYVGNQIGAAENHYYGLREAIPDLPGIAILDDVPPDRSSGALSCLGWHRREIENYLCSRATLEAYVTAAARATAVGPLFVEQETSRCLAAISEAIDEIERARETLGQGSPWDDEVKVSDDFLPRLFDLYFGKLGIPNLMHKTSFYKLVEHVPEAEIDPEISEKLDAIARVAEIANPAEDM